MKKMAKKCTECTIGHVADRFVTKATYREAVLKLEEKIREFNTTRKQCHILDLQPFLTSAPIVAQR